MEAVADRQHWIAPDARGLSRTSDMTTIITRRSPTPSRGARNSPTERSRIAIRRRRPTAVVRDAAGGAAPHDDSGGATTRVFPEINEEDDALTVALKLGSAGIATVATAPGRSRIPSSVDRDWTHASTTNSHELVSRVVSGFRLEFGTMGYVCCCADCVASR